MTDQEFKNINELCDWWGTQLEWTAYSIGENICHDLGQLIKSLEKFYNKKDDHLPWDELDRDLAFQYVIDTFFISCMSSECIQILAIFCLDRGLFFCQMGGLKDEAHEEYLLSAVVSAKRLVE